MKNAIILMGLPLSGKTTWIKDKLLYVSYTVVSADEIKKTHANYNPDTPEDLHEWSVKEAEKQVQALVNGKKNIIMDGGGINNSYTVRIIYMLKANNYRFKLVHIKTPYNICIERMKERTRKVPVQSIMDKAVKENAQFHRLSELADEVEVVPYFTNKHWFIDMDGVVAALTTLPVFDGEIDFVNGQVHKYLKPVEPIIRRLSSMYQEQKMDSMYILSAAPTSINIDEKNEWLDNFFPIPPCQRFFVNRGMYKAEMLEGLQKRFKMNKRDIVLLDDFHSTLYEVKERGMNAMHPSEFLTLKL